MKSLWNCFISRAANLHTTVGVLLPIMRRPPSSFALFIQDRKNTYPYDKSATSQSVMQSLAKEWKNLNLHEKQEYTDRARELMATFKEAMGSLTVEEKLKLLNEKKELKETKLKKKEIKIKASRPKRPLMAFNFFLKEAFLHEELRNSDITDKSLWRDINQQWKQLPSSEKAKYSKMAEEDKARYLEEMEAYVKKLRADGHEHLIPKAYEKKWLKNPWDQLTKINWTKK